MMIRTAVLWTGLLIGTRSSGVGAQRGATPPAPTTYGVAGTVVDGSGATLSGAEVSAVVHDTVRSRVHTGDDGRFRFEELPAPNVLLRVRRLGYEAKSVAVVASTSAVAMVVVKLESTAAALDAVMVDAKAEKSVTDLRLVAFRERASTNHFGHYVTEAALARIRPSQASEAVRGLPGVTVRPGRRGGNLIRLRGCGAGGSSDRVGPLVWLDGVRLPGAELDDVVQGADVAAIEVYNSFAGIPAQYFDRTAVCGTILVWTKSS